MKQVLKIVAINILIILLLLVISEIIIYIISIKKDFVGSCDKPPTFGYDLTPIVDRTLIKDFFNGKDNFYSGRTPDGLEYDAMPLIIFGCSYAFGYNLDKTQTISYKLSQALKKPVYNRAISGQGMQEMYYQTTQDDFYNDIEHPDSILYVFIDDHIRRLYSDSFYIWRQYFMLNYDIRYGELFQKTYYNKFVNFFRSLYTVKLIKQIYVKYYIENPKNSEKIAEDTLTYFVKTRANLEKHYGHKFKFCVLFYSNTNKYKKIEKKLSDYGFEVVSTNDLTNEDLFTNKKYMQDNNHPTEEAWNHLVPKMKDYFFNEQ